MDVWKCLLPLLSLPTQRAHVELLLDDGGAADGLSQQLLQLDALLLGLLQHYPAHACEHCSVPTARRLELAKLPLQKGRPLEPVYAVAVKENRNMNRVSESVSYNEHN